MSWLTALVFATPLFGFQLAVPTLDAPAVTEPVVEVVASPVVTPESAIATVAAEPEEDEEDRYFEDLRLRRKLAPVHRILGISTWASMTVTVALGAMRYYDRYGFGASRDNNPCTRGTAIFGTEGCVGSPWYHTASAIMTASLYAATISLAMFMPDPDDASVGDGEDASRLRTHKLLRWVHLGAMVAQMVLGPIMSRVGDRTNDYGLHQALATTHMAIGLIGYGALTWAGALML